MESFLLPIILLLQELEMVINSIAVYMRNHIENYKPITGEGCDANPVISTEIKESVLSYRVETEPFNEE